MYLVSMDPKERFLCPAIFQENLPAKSSFCFYLVEVEE